MVLVVCLAVLVLLGLLERAAGGRAYAAVPVRVHVNGTRGKSTVTRLVAAALREAGVPTLAKVTGTVPRLIGADGTERPVRRLGPANIREQAWLLRVAKRTGARAVVAECMAVRPDLQWVAEREMVRATVGVITNARLDHIEVMGRTDEEVARSLAHTVPRRAVLVVGEPRFADLFAARCASLGTRLVVAPLDVATSDAPCPKSDVGPRTSDLGRFPSWLREDIAIALAVTRELGIADEVAVAGFRKAAPDPGAVTSSTTTLAGREVAWIDATAANDPESLDRLVTGLKPCSTGVAQNTDVAQGFSPVIVYNHRADRPDRLRTFARHSATFRRGAAILLTGDRPSLTLAADVRRLCPRATPHVVPSRRLAGHLAGAVAASSAGLIVFCGNTRGWKRPC